MRITRLALRWTQHRHSRTLRLVQEEELIDRRFGRAVRHMRDAAGLSQPELARAFAEDGGTPRDATGITRLERGSRRVGLGEAVILARVLGTTVDKMIGED